MLRLDCFMPSHRFRCGLVSRWAGRVLAEFFKQGDTERASGVAISPMMDRTTTSPAMNQTNFIEFIVAPLFHQV